jgi:hypothetical protein
MENDHKNNSPWHSHEYLPEAESFEYAGTAEAIEVSPRDAVFCLN